MKKQKQIIIVLVVILAVAIGYIVYSQIQDYNDEQAKKIYLKGMEAGYEAAAKQMYEELSACREVAVHAGNETINAFSVQCLHQEMFESLPQE